MWDEHPHVLARRAQSLREGEAAAEGVAVGVLVTEDQDLLVGVEELFDLVVEAAGLALRGGYRWSSSVNPTKSEPSAGFRGDPSELSAAGSTSLSSSLI